MRRFITLVRAALVAASSLITVSSYAGEGHDHGPRYGGVVREVKELAYELVAKPNSLTLYINDHGSPVATQGAVAQVTLVAGSARSSASLIPVGENRMAAQGSFVTGVGVRALLTITLPGKPVAKVTFKLK